MDSISSESQHSFHLESCDMYGLFKFSHIKTPNLMVFREISFTNEMFLWLNKKRNFLLLLNRKRLELHVLQRRQPKTLVRFSETLNVLQMRQVRLFTLENHASFSRIYLSIPHK